MAVAGEGTVSSPGARDAAAQLGLAALERAPPKLGDPSSPLQVPKTGDPLAALSPLQNPSGHRGKLAALAPLEVTDKRNVTSGGHTDKRSPITSRGSLTSFGMEARGKKRSTASNLGEEKTLSEKDANMFSQEKTAGSAEEPLSSSLDVSRSLERNRPERLTLGKQRPVRVPVVPELLNKSSKAYEIQLAHVPKADHLRGWLQEQGIHTEEWGKNGTKDVTKLWKELVLQEAALEVWRSDEGLDQVVRVTHVLRAKVCSAESREKGIFLFNTWQQFAGGKKRTRNGLLSEKLSTAEMPLELHLKEVCTRAVTAEEMSCVVDAAYQVIPGQMPPRYDDQTQCPITVKDCFFVDHTMEVEISKSFPGLLTLYHLYTVEIVCEGLPGVDFNTLEWQEDGGKMSLKYVHAWVWLEWSQIQRYLFEGSELKERKKTGSFQDADALGEWLEQFELEIRSAGDEDNYDIAITDLFGELERGETQLELWGRRDGAPLLMQVNHVLQIRVVSADPRLQGKFLLRMWEQGKSGKVHKCNELLMSTLRMREAPYKEEDFVDAARGVVREQLMHLTDAHFRLRPDALPTTESAQLWEDSDPEVAYHAFKEHTFRTEESPVFRGLFVMDHLYNMEVLVDGLPVADFGSLYFESSRGPLASGWKWMTLQQAMDFLQTQVRKTERSQLEAQALCEKCVQGSRRAAGDLGELLQALRLTEKGESLEPLEKVRAEFQAVLGGSTAASSGPCEERRPSHAASEQSRNKARSGTASETLRSESSGLTRTRPCNGALKSLDGLPPLMVSKMAMATIALDSYLEEAYHANIVRTAALHEQMARGKLEQQGWRPVSHAMSQVRSECSKYTMGSRMRPGLPGDVQSLPPSLPPPLPTELTQDVPEAGHPNAVLDTIKSNSRARDDGFSTVLPGTTASGHSRAEVETTAKPVSIHSEQRMSLPRYVVKVAACASLFFCALQIAMGAFLVQQVNDEELQVVCVLILVFGAFSLSACAVIAVWAHGSASTFVPSPSAWELA